MRAVLLLFLYASFGCTNLNSKQKMQGTLVGDSILISRYISFGIGDSTSKTFKWTSVRDLRVTAGGDVKFIFKKDGSIRKISARNQVDTLDYVPFKMSTRQTAKIPKTIMEDKFHLLGVYEQVPGKDSGLYFALFRYKDYMLLQCHEVIGNVVGYVVFSTQERNPLKDQGVTFPYSNNFVAGKEDR